MRQPTAAGVGASLLGSTAVLGACGTNCQVCCIANREQEKCFGKESRDSAQVLTEQSLIIQLGPVFSCVGNSDKYRVRSEMGAIETVEVASKPLRVVSLLSGDCQ